MSLFILYQIIIISILQSKIQLIGGRIIPLFSKDDLKYGGHAQDEPVEDTIIVHDSPSSNVKLRVSPGPIKDVRIGSTQPSSERVELPTKNTVVVGSRKAPKTPMADTRITTTICPDERMIDSCVTFYSAIKDADLGENENVIQPTVTVHGITTVGDVMTITETLNKKSSKGGGPSPKRISDKKPKGFSTKIVESVGASKGIRD